MIWELKETADAIIVSSSTRQFVPKMFLAFAINPALDGGSSRESAPLVFARPDGCDLVDFSFGPIQANPGFGEESDLALPVRISGPRWTVDEKAVHLIVPWRSAPSVFVPAGRLRMPVYARFSMR